MSEITFVGNLVDTPEVRVTREGKPWASFTLVKSERVRQGDDWVDGDPTFFDCVTFEYGADNLAELEKGTRLIVTGDVKQQVWEKDGQKRSKLQILVKEVGVSTRFGSVAFTKRRSGVVSGSSGMSGQGQTVSSAQGGEWHNPGQSFDDTDAPF